MQIKVYHKNNELAFAAKCIGDELCSYIKNKELYTSSYEDIGVFECKILSNNGIDCSNAKIKIAEIENEMANHKSISLNPYYLVFVIGAKANSANQYFDFTETRGTKILFIFLDYFEDMNTTELEDSEEDMDQHMKYIMGNSNYFEALIGILGVFMTTCYGMYIKDSDLSRTVIGNIYYAGLPMMSAIILNRICPITENDVDNVDMEAVKVLSIDEVADGLW